MKSFILAFCFAASIDGLSVDGDAGNGHILHTLSHDVSVKAAHAKHHAKHAKKAHGKEEHETKINLLMSQPAKAAHAKHHAKHAKKAHGKAEHEAKVNLLMSQNPQSTKLLCDACVAAEEDLVGNHTVLTDALTNQEAASTALNDARSLYETCTDEQTARYKTMDTLERALRSRLTTGINQLASLKSMLESTLFEVNVPDADGAYASATRDPSYDGNGLLAQIDAWRTAFNNHATKMAECATKNATAQALASSLTGNNTVVTDAEAAVQAANQTTVQACDAMRNGFAPPRNNCQDHYDAGVRTPSHSRAVDAAMTNDVPTTTYDIFDGSTEVATQCAFWHDRGWTLTLKITNDATSGSNPGKSLKGTGAINVGALVTSPIDGQAGKLSDEWIKANCDGQYIMQQYGSAGTPMRYYPEYCKFTDIGLYADQTRTSKICSGNTETYQSDGSYSTTTNSASSAWTNGFSSWAGAGDLIVQLYHQDGRLGSHIQQGGHSQEGCTSSGGCHVMIWCAKA